LVAEIVSINEESWDDEVKIAKSPVVVYFYATRCQPCEIVSPVVKKLAAEYDGSLRFVKVDVDKSRKIADYYVVDEIPRLIIFRDGKMYEQVTGADNIEKRCKNLIARNVEGGDRI
jgi:thioredoxin 1